MGFKPSPDITLSFSKTFHHLYRLEKDSIRAMLRQKDMRGLLHYCIGRANQPDLVGLAVFGTYIETQADHERKAITALKNFHRLEKLIKE